MTTPNEYGSPTHDWGQASLDAMNTSRGETRWIIRHPDGETEEAGILGENRARMIARKVGGEPVEIPADEDLPR